MSAMRMAQGKGRVADRKNMAPLGGRAGPRPVGYFGSHGGGNRHKAQGRRTPGVLAEEVGQAICRINHGSVQCCHA